MYEPKMEYVMTVRLKLGALQRIQDNARGEERIFIDVTEGTFEGPKLKGTVVPQSGGDYALKRPGGELEFDARYLLKEEDGTIIYMQNYGLRWGSPEIMQKLSNHEDVDRSEYYMCTSPRFEVKRGPHDWLTKYIFVGFGEKTPEGNAIHYYKLY